MFVLFLFFFKEGRLIGLFRVVASNLPPRLLCGVIHHNECETAPCVLRAVIVPHVARNIRCVLINLEITQIETANKKIRLIESHQFSTFSIHHTRFLRERDSKEVYFAKLQFFFSYLQFHASQQLVGWCAVYFCLSEMRRRCFHKQWQILLSE